MNDILNATINFFIYIKITFERGYHICGRIFQGYYNNKPITPTAPATPAPKTGAALVNSTTDELEVVPVVEVMTSLEVDEADEEVMAISLEEVVDEADVEEVVDSTAEDVEVVDETDVDEVATEDEAEDEAEEEAEDDEAETLETFLPSPSQVDLNALQAASALPFGQIESRHCSIVCDSLEQKQPMSFNWVHC